MPPDADALAVLRDTGALLTDRNGHEDIDASLLGEASPFHEKVPAVVAAPSDAARLLHARPLADVGMRSIVWLERPLWQASALGANPLRAGFYALRRPRWSPVRRSGTPSG